MNVVVRNTLYKIKMSEKPKSLGVYAEMVSVTILSLVAASMWIELTKGTICRVFDNSPLVLLVAAIFSTFMAIYGLKYLFCDIPSKKMYSKENIN